MAIVSEEAIRDPDLAWFRAARFGMFVHFGLYALLGRGEWVQYRGNIPRDEYERLMDRFDPHLFDADQWVDLAEQAGCRYITVTAKHHDGFCLFDSALTDYKITNTPFRRDLIGELTAACRRRGMRIAYYYSQPDWHHPNFVHLPGAFKDLDTPPPDQQPDWPNYLDYYIGQVRELCTNYGRIDGIWFDGSHKSEETWQGRRVYRMIKELQPSALVNDRARCGDFFTPERTLPEDLSGYMFEACQCICQRFWGYAEGTPQFSVPNLVNNLVRVAGAGGNFLLNVGPAPDGTIAPWQAERLRAVGQWLGTCGEAIYGTDAGRVDTGSADVLATRKGNNLYLFFCRWADTDQATVPGVRAMPVAAQLLTGGIELQPALDDTGLTISALPMLPPDPCVNVVKLSFDTPPELIHTAPPAAVVPTIGISNDSRTVLSVADAEPRGFAVKGHRLTVDTVTAARGGKIAAVTGWMTPDQALRWRIDVAAAGRYNVRIKLSCPAAFDGSEYLIQCGRACTTGIVKPTPSYRSFRWQEAGTLALAGGTAELVLRPVWMPYGYIFAHVAGLSLRPTATPSSGRPA